MKQIIAKKGIILVDDEDFDELSKYRWVISGGYAKHEFWKDNKPNPTLIHRFILGQLAENKIVDHIDRNPLNNQKSNLRICTQSENIFNSPRKKNNKSGFVGVRFYQQQNKWEAYIMKDRKKYNLGRYDTIEKAIKARADAERLLFPNFNRTVCQ
mgnify:CR=1 FL=1